MKPYVFSVGILLMLSLTLAGATSFTAGLLRSFPIRHARAIAFAIGVVSLVALIAALGWSVPPRG